MPKSAPLCDLHIHVGASVAPHILWAIAHEQGFKLPVKDFWEFKQMITVDPRKCKSLDDYLRILHEWTEKMQSRYRKSGVEGQMLTLGVCQIIQKKFI